MQKAIQLRNCDFVWLHLAATVEFFIVENLHPVMIVIHIKCVYARMLVFIFAKFYHLICFEIYDLFKNGSPE